MNASYNWILALTSYARTENVIPSKQNKKNPEHPFVDIIKYKTCAKFQQKILNSMVVGARSQFFRQKTWFLGNDRPLP